MHGQCNDNRNITAPHIMLALTVRVKKALSQLKKLLPALVFQNTLSVLIFAPRKKNNRKTFESWDLRLMFLSRSTERQAGHGEKKNCYLLILKKS